MLREFESKFLCSERVGSEFSAGGYRKMCGIDRDLKRMNDLAICECVVYFGN